MANKIEEKKVLSAGSTLEEQLANIGQPEVAQAEIEESPASKETFEAANAGVNAHIEEIEAGANSGLHDLLDYKSESLGAEIPPAIEVQLEENENVGQSAWQKLIDALMQEKNSSIEAPIQPEVKPQPPEDLPVADTFNLKQKRDELMQAEKTPESEPFPPVPENEALSQLPELKDFEAGPDPEITVHEKAQDDYRLYTKKKFFVTRIASAKYEKIKNWGERITGLSSENKKEWRETRYDLLGRTVIRIRNFWDKLGFNWRGNSIMKAESKIEILRSKISDQQAENNENLRIRDDSSRPYKERKRAAKAYNAGIKKFNQWVGQEAKKSSQLTRCEDAQRDCLERINERTLAVSEDIEDRIAPLNEKLIKANEVLRKAQEARDFEAGRKAEMQSKLDDLKIRALSVDKKDRAKVREVIKKCKLELKEYNKKYKQAEAGLSACQSNISELEALINPWERLSAAYKDMAEVKAQEPLKEFESARAESDLEVESGYAAQSAERLIRENDVLNPAEYIKLLEKNLGFGAPKITKEEENVMSGKTWRDNTLANLQNNAKLVLKARGFTDRQITKILDLTRVMYKK